MAGPICGDCTLCCQLFPIRELGKPPNTPCQHLVDSGCEIHGHRQPAECSSFECGYYQSPAAPELRPDRCGVVFERLSARLFFGTVAVGLESPAARRQVASFLDQGFSVVLAMNRGRGRSRLFVARDHREADVRREFQEHVQRRYG